MAQYLTLPKIAKRLGYKTSATVYRLLIEEGLPMYKKYKPARWYTTDDLIQAWELEKCKRHREELIKRRSKRKELVPT